jgi:DNA-binding CsgD family transcriptional regulator
MGGFAAAVALAEELRAAADATESRLPPYGPLVVAAWQGREAEAEALIDTTTAEVASLYEGLAQTAAHWARALLCNSVGRSEDALAAAAQASAHPEDLAFYNWGLVELIEAAVRTGKRERGTDAFDRLAARTRGAGTDWALGIEARSRALLSSGEVAEGLYQDAIERLGRTLIRVDLARAHLLYAEWLRRERRRSDAREQARTAREMFTAMGAEAFAQRAERELLATGETVRKRNVESRDELTAQEGQIARLARDGLSNIEIGARLFISPRTVEYHLHKVFAKLDISSRNQLGGALPREPTAALAG